MARKKRRGAKKAAAAAKRKQTVAHLPKRTRRALGKEGAKAAREKSDKSFSKSVLRHDRATVAVRFSHTIQVTNFRRIRVMYSYRAIRFRSFLGGDYLVLRRRRRLHFRNRVSRRRRYLRSTVQTLASAAFSPWLKAISTMTAFQILQP